MNPSTDRSLRTRAVRALAVACALAAALVFAGSSADVTGTWNLEFQEGANTVHPTLVLEEKDGRLGGRWSGPRGTVALDDVKYEGGVLTFTMVQKAVLRETEVRFRGEVGDGKLRGVLQAPRGEVAVHGSRAAESR